MGHPTCSIPDAVYRRLWLLYLVERFHDACYGAVRLQKVAYFAEEGEGRVSRPFTFCKAPYGPYSEELRETLEQLLSMGLVASEPIGSTGNKYRVPRRERQPCPHARWLGRVDAAAKRAIDEAVEKHGYLGQSALLEAGHRVEGFDEAGPFDALLKADIPSSIPVDLTEEECEELVLSLSPSFVGVLRGLAETDWESDLDKVRLVETL